MRFHLGILVLSNQSEGRGYLKKRKNCSIPQTVGILSDKNIGFAPEIILGLKREQ